MPTINADDGCPLHVEVEGREGAPVLMLSNSLGTNLHMWDDQAPEFAKHFRLVRYDRRGHGKSGVPKGPYSMERFGRDVLSVIDALKDQEDQLVRAVDGRHGRPMAGRQCPRPHRKACALEHQLSTTPTRPRGTIASNSCTRKASANWSDRTWSDGSPRISALARLRRSRA